MAFLGGQTGHHELASLDNLGMTAAIYPSEEQLWYYGPTISTGPGGDDYARPIEDPTEMLTAPPVPASGRDVATTQELIFRQQNDQTPNDAVAEEWVNLTTSLPAGFGPWSDAPYYTGHSQVVRSNPASEQGWGVGPARRWAHYPFSQLDNPTRNAATHLRNGDLPWVYSEQNMLYYRSQLAWEQQWDQYKQRGPVTPVVPVATSVPFTQTVPTYGGGPLPYTGLDIPGVTPTFEGGIY